MQIELWESKRESQADSYEEDGGWEDGRMRGSRIITGVWLHPAGKEDRVGRCGKETDLLEAHQI